MAMLVPHGMDLPNSPKTSWYIGTSNVREHSGPIICVYLHLPDLTDFLTNTKGIEVSISAAWLLLLE